MGTYYLFMIIAFAILVLWALIPFVTGDIESVDVVSLFISCAMFAVSLTALLCVECRTWVIHIGLP